MLKIELPLPVFIYIDQRRKEELFELLIVKFKTFRVEDLLEQIKLHVLRTKFGS